MCACLSVCTPAKYSTWVGTCVCVRVREKRVENVRPKSYEHWYKFSSRRRSFLFQSLKEFPSMSVVTQWRRWTYVTLSLDPKFPHSLTIHFQLLLLTDTVVIFGQNNCSIPWMRCFPVSLAPQVVARWRLEGWWSDTGRRPLAKQEPHSMLTPGRRPFLPSPVTLYTQTLTGLLPLG